MTTSEKSKGEPSPQLTFLSGYSLVRTYPLQAIVKDWLEAAHDSFLSSFDLLTKLGQTPLLSKMFPVFFHRTKEKTSHLLLASLPGDYPGLRSKVGGMLDFFEGESTTSPIGFSIRNFSESPKNAEESLLWEVLETEVQQKYFLTPRGRAGIRNRILSRGKTIPALLDSALLATTSTPKPTKRHRSKRPTSCPTPVSINHRSQ